jgi:hypothetical protein
VTGTATRTFYALRVSGPDADPLEGGDIDLIRIVIFLFRQLAKGRRSELPHHTVGQHPGFILTVTILDAIPALLEVETLGDLVIFVAGAAGLTGAVGLVGVFPGQGVDNLALIGLEVKGGTFSPGGQGRRRQPQQPGQGGYHPEHNPVTQWFHNTLPSQRGIPLWYRVLFHIQPMIKTNFYAARFQKSHFIFCKESARRS